MAGGPQPKTFQTNEAAKLIGVSRPTLLRWFREGKVTDVKRDRRNWRVFSERDIRRLRAYAQSSGGGE